MPLHISEIGVHLAVGGEQAAPAEAAPATPAAGAPATSALSEADIEHIVNRCVTEVLKQIKQQQADR